MALLSVTTKLSCHFASCRLPAASWSAFHERHIHRPNMSRCASMRPCSALLVPQPRERFSRYLAQRSERSSDRKFSGCDQLTGRAESNRPMPGRKLQPGEFIIAGSRSTCEPSVSVPGMTT